MLIWKLVFAFTAMSFLVNAWNLPNDHEIITIIFILIEGLTMFPLFGYAYQVAIGSKSLSAIIFRINVLLIAVSWIYIYLKGYIEFNVMGILGLLFGAAISFIFIYPQFAYSFRSKNIWEQSAT